MHVENDKVSAALIRQIRSESGLKQVELARRSGLQSSVLSAYEHARIAAAAGMEVQLTPASGQPALERAGTILAQVLDLAEQLPYRPRRELAYPPLARLAA
jgi:transcriptional regulator with XRE-family HTH domain